MEILHNFKRKAFPNIKNWTSEHNDLRHHKKWWEMPTLYIIFFNRYGTRMFMTVLLIFIIALSSYLVFMGVKLNMQGNYIFGIILFVIVALILRGLLKNKYYFSFKSDMILYDLILKESKR